MEVVQGGDNVFEDIGFDRAEAANLRVRADLMLDLRKYIEVNGWTQREAAAAFWVRVRLSGISCLPSRFGRRQARTSRLIDLPVWPLSGIVKRELSNEETRNECTFLRTTGLFRWTGTDINIRRRVK